MFLPIVCTLHSKNLTKLYCLKEHVFRHLINNNDFSGELLTLLGLQARDIFTSKTFPRNYYFIPLLMWYKCEERASP